MQLKNYKREGITSVWSNSKNHNELLVSTAPNPYNQNLFDLEILSVDFTDRSKDLNILGKSSYNVPFRCLAWDTFGEKDDTYTHGLVFGGMQNGSFTLWNPTDIIGKRETIKEEQIDDQPALLYAEELDEEASPILCAEWNALRNNYLAFGSTNLLLMDIGKDVSSPELLKPSQKNPHEGSYITSVTWNKEVPHILASAGSDGLIALWDIKTNKSIFNFKDSSQITAFRQVEIAWSKHVSTQIAVTLDDERKNQLQIWDLRNKKGPIVVIDREHSKGINSMDWSELDHDLILTASRDHKVVCWNYKEDEHPKAVREVESEIVKVAWSRTLSSIYSVTTNEGLEIYSLDDKNILSYVPKWMKLPVSTTFNGNANYMVHSQERDKNFREYKVELSAGEEMGKEISRLQEFFDEGNVNDNSDDVWRLIAIKNSPDFETEIYDFLDLNKEKIIDQAEKYTGKKRDSCTINERKAKPKDKTAKLEYIPFDGQAAENFFGSLGVDDDQENQINDDENQRTEEIKYDMVPRNSNWSIGKERIIKENMLIGNYEGAIDAALKCGRTAEALIIAYSIDQNTFNSTLKTFFTETTDHFISDILKHIAFKETDELVRKYNIEKWKECIGLIYSISAGEKRRSLLALLGERILEEPKEYEEAAVICFILAEKFSSVVEIYENRLRGLKLNSSVRKATLINLGTRLLCIKASLTVTAKQHLDFDKMVREMGLICLERGQNLLAYNLFTTYVPLASAKFIDYLIFNTSQLSNYRTPPPILSLPVMAPKKKNNPKKGKQSQQQDEPPSKFRGPAKPIPVPEQDTDKIKLKKRGPTPIPVPPSHVQDSRDSQPLPKRTPPINELGTGYEKKPVPVPVPPKKEKFVPPPPPKPQPQQSWAEEQEEQPAHTQIQPRLAVKRNVPPPPPPIQKQEEPVSQKKVGPPPPPPQPIQTPLKNVQKQVAPTYQEKQESPYYSKQDNNRVQPPPPPPPQKLPHPTQKQTFRPPPPQQHPTYTNEDQDSSAEEFEEKKANSYLPPARNPPARTPPPPQPKSVKPPPTFKPVETKEPVEEEAPIRQAPTRAPPAPPGRRGPPPPPPRR